jgi:predicted naringenin-chalcone synthase
MGCYAAFNAIKVADAFCKANEKNNVLIVCTEMCSLHFQKEPTDDNLLANGLFADGAAALLMENNPPPGFALTPVAFHNALSFTPEQHMTWSIGNTGFEMMLSSYVPQVIQGGIHKLTSSMLDKLNKKITDIKHFAIHPGGKKILDVIERELGINKEKNLPAYHVLKNFGNMSSPTVLFVLKEIFKSLSPDDDHEHVLSFAFGPGLTLESMILKIEYHA